MPTLAKTNKNLMKSFLGVQLEKSIGVFTRTGKNLVKKAILEATKVDKAIAFPPMDMILAMSVLANFNPALICDCICCWASVRPKGIPSIVTFDVSSKGF